MISLRRGVSCQGTGRGYPLALPVGLGVLNSLRQKKQQSI